MGRVQVQPYTFFRKDNLTRVDLYANQIRELDQNALRISPLAATSTTPPEFYMGGNPFQVLGCYWIACGESSCTLASLQSLRKRNDHELKRNFGGSAIATWSGCSASTRPTT